MSENGYIPGSCNIGKEEIRMRKNTTILMGAISLIFGCVLIYFAVNPLWRLTLFLPLLGFSIGAIQWYNHFCVYFGLKGTFNFENIGSSTSIIEDELRKKDIAKSRNMIFKALLFSLALTIAFWLIPI